MKRLIGFAIAGVVLLAMGSTQAKSVTFGSKLVVVGDTTGDVFNVAGKPDRIVEVQNRKGAVIGERFEYFRRGKTIALEIRNGKVTAVSEQGVQDAP